MDKKKYSNVSKINGERLMLPINYLLATYIVTSKPNLISVATGFVHMFISPFIKICNICITSIIILLGINYEVIGELVYAK